MGCSSGYSFLPFPWHEWCLFILSVCLWLLLQPLGLAFTSSFLPLKSVCPISWPWTGSKMTPTHTHWTSFQMATPTPQETVKQHMFWPTPSQSPLSCCHRLLPLFQTWELCVHHFQRTQCQALQVASFTSLSLKGSPQKPTSPLPAPLAHRGRATGHSQHSNRSLQEITLQILLPAMIPFVIFHLPEGSKRHGSSL